LLLASLLPAAGRAQAQPRAPDDDPYEKLNRASFAFSMRLDRYIVGPVARLSAGLTPEPLVRIIHNIIVNLSEPQVILNDLLQARPQRAVQSATRLVVNSSFGLAGALDVAAGAGLRHEANGFGDTLGRYGVKSGPYIYIPILGPSDVRDLAGAAADQFSTPMVFVSFPYRTEVNISLALANGLTQRARAGPQLQALFSGAADPYATLRSTYLQAREAEIRGETNLPPLPDIEGLGQAPPSTDPGEAQAPTPAPVNPAPTPAPPSAAAADSSPAGPQPSATL
jgi:phospholipid-binding lipoprotein MlaA